MVNETFEMTKEEVRERIGAINNICYITYTNTNIKIIICTILAACIIISSPYVIIASNGMSLNSIDPVEWWGIITPIILSISILIISIIK